MRSAHDFSAASASATAWAGPPPAPAGPGAALACALGRPRPVEDAEAVGLVVGGGAEEGRELAGDERDPADLLADPYGPGAGADQDDPARVLEGEVGALVLMEHPRGLGPDGDDRHRAVHARAGLADALVARALEAVARAREDRGGAGPGLGDAGAGLERRRSAKTMTGSLLCSVPSASRALVGRLRARDSGLGARWRQCQYDSERNQQGC